VIAKCWDDASWIENTITIHRLARYTGCNWTNSLVWIGVLWLRIYPVVKVTRTARE
jgi:hypothetical protein